MHLIKQKIELRHAAILWYNLDHRMEVKMLKCASFFAGVGGIDKGFEAIDAFDIVYANEIDPYPVKHMN